LRLLASDPLPAVPRAEDLLDCVTLRRPGELHEALPLDSFAAHHAATEASKSGLAIDVAASILLEAGLAVSDVGHQPVSSGVSASAHMLALPESNARYLRSLTVARRPRRSPLRAQRSVAIPVRLVPRLANFPIDSLISAVGIDRALDWEIAALCEGRTLNEWVLMSAQRER